MEKIREINYNIGTSKFYNYGKKVEPLEFIDELISKGIPVDTITVKRDAEMDMQIGVGTFSLEELRKKMPSLEAGDSCLFRIKTEFNGIPVEINFDNDSNIVYMRTPDNNIELTSLYEKKTSGLSL